MEKNYQIILDNLLRIKEEKQLSYQDLAEKIDLSKSSVQRYFTGEISNFPLKHVFALANAMSVDVPTLLNIPQKDNSFGERLHSLRISKGLSQRELGDLIGISDRVVGYYESNNRFPKDIGTLKSISTIFNISLDSLILDCNLSGESILTNVELLFSSMSNEEKRDFFNSVLDVYMRSMNG